MKRQATDTTTIEVEVALPGISEEEEGWAAVVNASADIAHFTVAMKGHEGEEKEGESTRNITCQGEKEGAVEDEVSTMLALGLALR
ncbi:hypothetical protein VYU27_001943 [Nannochloropsis oceanica]